MNHTSSKDLRKYCYFSCLSDGALEAISHKLEPVTLPAGSHIIKEGAPANSFYLICRGEVEVTKKNEWGQTAKITVAGQGESFGEMALLTCSPRFGSVTALTDVTLLKLLKRDFDEIVRQDSVFAGMMVDRHQSFYRYNDIKTAQPFALLTPEKMSALMDRLKEKTFSRGAKIIIQGETGDAYYIIKSGRADVLKLNMSNEIEKVGTLMAGQGFGEEALITKSPRSATVQAVEETVVWVLTKENFESVTKAAFLKEIEPENISFDSKGSIHYLDVRMKAEFDEEHIPGAVNIPLDELRRRYSEFSSADEYYVYCLMGDRSASASFLMNSQGFKAKSIKGGIINWPGPVEKGNDGVHRPFKPT